MIVLLHVLIAVSSLALVTYTFIKPNNKLLLGSYLSIFATIASGLYLVWVEPARMLHTCEVGLVYLAVASTGVIAARIRFSKLKKSIKIV